MLLEFSLDLLKIPLESLAALFSKYDFCFGHRDVRNTLLVGGCVKRKCSDVDDVGRIGEVFGFNEIPCTK